MPAASPPVLDRRALNRALLARQLLLERAGMPAADAVEHLVGMQAQAPNPPYLGLWTRLDGFRTEDLAELVRGRQAVRLVMMRSTIHLVTARDCLRLRPVLAESLARTLQSAFGRGLAGLDLDEVVRLGRRLLEEEPLTLGGLGTRLAEKWPDRDGFALANAVRNLAPLVQLPPRGLWGESGQAVHATAESWLDAPLESDTSPDAVVLRYLAAFGPASVKDMQMWSGMTRLAAAVKRLRDELLVFRDETGRELYDLPDAPRPDPGTAAPVRLLPEFDNILLSHADRSRILTEDQRRTVMTRNGLIKSTVLVDGFVAGLWRLEQQRDAAAVVVEPLVPLTRREQDAVEAEAGRLLDFAAPGAATHEVRTLSGP
ncbi:winged helix DNA-binding domain-containing protein [Streptacidiphilus griseoplanus]|uniref:winged helix DNA-binding domain-containing protein n=1 Tax=Peterkaempfera griseoplana TaxID=66896 RepID=UPI0006E33D7F|nr:winged helix DNA-binding domain-containing protein [Peterkaempfera griseoplana]